MFRKHSSSGWYRETAQDERARNGNALKAARQRRIVQLIRQPSVTSQHALVRLLRAEGYPATQATVSRDLDELGAVKVKRDGRVIYALPGEVPAAPAGDVLRRLLTESVVGLDQGGSLLVVKTLPGHASMVASGFDRGEVEGIAGTIAGDDTVLVVCETGVMPKRVERQIRSIIEALPIRSEGKR